MENIDFREKLKEMMIKKNNISIALLARQANLSYLTLYNYLKNRSEMTAANLAKVFDALAKIEESEV